MNKSHLALPGGAGLAQIDRVKKDGEEDTNNQFHSEINTLDFRLRFYTRGKIQIGFHFQDFMLKRGCLGEK